jgi:hypothetical protein
MSWVTSGGTPRAVSYQILDDPRPSGLAHLAVNPLWPLLAVMFGGTWLSWPWFALNGFAVGSPTRRRELALAAGGFAGSLALALGVLVLVGAGVVRGVGISYALIALTVWKLGVTYALHTLQVRSFHLYEYYGGATRNGIGVVFLGGLLGRKAVLAAVAWPLWRIVLS